MYLTIIFIPLLNFLFIILFGRFVNKKTLLNYIIKMLILTFLLCNLAMFEVVLSWNNTSIKLVKWIQSDNLQIYWGFYFDIIVVLMLWLVTFISLLVHIYSIEYMKEDPHLIRFMSLLSLFTFFMFFLVSADNYVQMFLGWEGVGLASYLLINFWHSRWEANKAALKAIIINRIGDLGILLSLLCIFYTFESFDYLKIFFYIEYVKNNFFYFLDIKIGVLSFINFCLFLGIIAKSAQIGLHTWLVDAMEGPTPVSALIHAATMVTAGVFLLIRSAPFYQYNYKFLCFVALIGALTALFSAVVACYQNDIKKIVAYSTCSQLGFMIAACGLVNFNLALAHLVNHAFYKALLFLGSGFLIHYFLDEQDIRRTGFVAWLNPLIYIFMLIGSISLLGLPFLTGFWSKHLILESGLVSFQILSFFISFFLIMASFFSGLYTFKLIFCIFFFKNNSYNKYMNLNKQKVSYAIIIVLIVLSLSSIFLGYVFKDILIGFENFIWNKSTLIFVKHSCNFEVEFLSLFNKIKVSLLFFLSFIICIYISLLKKIINKRWYVSLSFFFKENGFLSIIYNNYFVVFTFYLTKITYKFLDKGLLSHIGPTGLSFGVAYLVESLIKMLTGLLYHYISFILVGLAVLFYIQNVYIYNIYILKMIGLFIYLGLIIFLIVYLIKKTYFNFLKN